MLDFEQYKKEQDEAEAAYEAALRKKKPHELTPEEIGYIVDQNNAFVGKTLDKGAEGRFNLLRETVAKMLEIDGARQTLTSPPDKSKPNAQISIDYGCVFSMDDDEIETFMTALAMSNSLCIACDEEGVRLTFEVKNIWQK